MTGTEAIATIFVPYGQGRGRGLDATELGVHGVELDRLVALGLPVVPGLTVPVSHATSLARPEVAQAAIPQARVVYVDNDPIVLAHARALLTSSPEGATGYLDADIRDTDEILAGAARLLDFSQPVGVMLVAVLHMLRDAERPQAIVDRLMSAVPAGSFLVISHLASDIEQETMAEMGRRLNESMTQQFTMRTRAQVTAFFDGLTLLDPGVVRTHEWRPDSAADAKTSGVLWAGVGRKD